VGSANGEEPSSRMKHRAKVPLSALRGHNKELHILKVRLVKENLADPSMIARRKMMMSFMIKSSQLGRKILMRGIQIWKEFRYKIQIRQGLCVICLLILARFQSKTRREKT
jgi:hypothetical protein